MYFFVLAPLITLMTSGEVIGTYELTFTALSHIYFIVTRLNNFLLFSIDLFIILNISKL